MALKSSPPNVLATLTLAPRASRPEGVAADTEAGIGRYRILRTDEVDAKDTPLTPQQRQSVVATGAAAATRRTGDAFKGTARKAAKLSIAEAQSEAFDTVGALIATLPTKEDMIQHDPPIKDNASSARVDEEERNIVVSAFLFAASREDDNDFHLIVGDDPASNAEVYMTMEVSGLPPANAASLAAIKAARDSFKQFFGDKTPGATYDFYDPPIPVRVEGSLFFDMTHAHGQSPGPPTLHPHMPVIWEVHPLSTIEFEPGPTS